MKKIFILLFTTSIVLSQTQIGVSLNGSNPGDAFGSKIVISENGNYIAVSSPRNDSNGNNSGKVTVYQNSNGSWTAYGAPILGINQPSTFGGSIFAGTFGEGLSMSEDGQTIAIGNSNSSAGPGNFSGQTQVFRYTNGSWIQLGGNINGNTLGEACGTNVSLSADGNTLVVGSASYDIPSENIGRATIYKFTNNNWTQFGQRLSGFQVNEFFGVRTSMSDDGLIIAIASPIFVVSGYDVGAVKTFKYINGLWEDYGTIFGPIQPENFSSSIDLSADGNTLAIGSNGASVSSVVKGSVDVWTKTINGWVSLSNSIDGESLNENFGERLSLSDDGTVLAVGSRFSDINGVDSGYVKVYKKTGVNYIYNSRVNGLVAGDLYGVCALSDDGTKLIVSSAQKDDAGIDSGQVRIFNLNAVLTTNEFSKNKINVYPNPATDIINLNIENQLNTVSVEIYNEFGQLLKTSNTLTNIAVSDLQNGIYLLQIKSENELQTVKFIKK